MTHFKNFYTIAFRIALPNQTYSAADRILCWKAFSEVAFIKTETNDRTI